MDDFTDRFLQELQSSRPHVAQNQDSANRDVAQMSERHYSKSMTCRTDEHTTENTVLDFPMTLHYSGLLDVHLLPQENREKNLSTCTLGKKVQHGSPRKQEDLPVVRTQRQV
jgi:hypothetical protein